MATSRALAAAAADLAPLVLYLQIDASEALSRAVAERGTAWLRRHADARAPPTAPADDLADVYRSREDERMRSFLEAGWPTATLDARGSPDGVLEAALAALSTPTR